MRKLNLLSAVFLFLAFLAAPKPVFSGIEADPGRLYKVQRILDGDTLVLSNEERIRMIGIDAPEVGNNPKLHRDARRSGQKVSSIRALGELSRSFTAYLTEGKNVYLEFEGQKRDRKGRYLAHVFLEDGTHVNAEIIRQGFAVVTDMPSLKYRDQFLTLQKEAIQNERGLWRKPVSIEYQLRSAKYSKINDYQRQELIQKVDEFRANPIQEPAAAYVPPASENASLVPPPQAEMIEEAILKTPAKIIAAVEAAPKSQFQAGFYEYWLPETPSQTLNN